MCLVYMVKHCHTHSVHTYIGNASEVEMEAFLNEAEILKTLSTQSCPYVVHLVGLQLEHAPPMIAMELVPCGNMLDILKSSSLAVSYSIRYQWILTQNSLTGLFNIFTHYVVDFVY